MRKLVICSVAAAVALGVSPAGADELMEKARAIFQPIPRPAPGVKGGAIAAEKIELGKMLFFDPRLSPGEMVSCNTCHNLATGGVDAGPTSVGHGWQAGPRRTPTVYNAIFNTAKFWDGRAEDLKARTKDLQVGIWSLRLGFQVEAKGPAEVSVEMNATPDHVVKALSSMPAYVAIFKKVFPAETSPVTFENFAKAVEAFEATLITPAAPFDRFLEGDAMALSVEERRGLELFMDKGCASCHKGTNVGGEAYFPFGVIEKPGADILPPGDKGRFAVTKTADDQYVFRAAPLRNVALRAPYFHSGQVWSLKQAVGIMGTAQLGTKLTDQEEDAIAAFLSTLTGEQPRIEYPILPVRTEATPEPKPVK